MKAGVQLFLLTILSSCCFAQAKFEQGYFIDDEGTRTDCLIRLPERDRNPITFSYRINHEAIALELDIEQSQEFAIGDHTKFTRNTVAIDVSGDDMDRLSLQALPEFSRQQVFLRVLLEGETNLYSYSNGSIRRFFYQRPGDEVAPLVYKRFRNASGGTSTNASFRKDLWNSLQCECISLEEISAVRYLQSDLLDVFARFHDCSDLPILVYKRERRGKFKLNLRTGIDQSHTTVMDERFFTNRIDFPRKINPRIGLEAEYFLPIMNDQWSVFMEPTFRNYDHIVELVFHEGTPIERSRVNRLKYRSIQVPIGFRYRYRLAPKHQFFADLAFFLESSGSSFLRLEGVNTISLHTGNDVALGIGYQYKSRWTTQFRYYVGRRILLDTSVWFADFKTISLIIGYSIPD